MRDILTIDRLRWATIALSVALFVAACASPAITYRTIKSYYESSQVTNPSASPHPNARLIGSERMWPGWELALSGWLGAVTLELSWYANPLLVLAWFLLSIRWYNAAPISAILAALLLSWLLLDRPIDQYSMSGPHTDARVAVHAGFWLWLASIAAALAGSVWCRQLAPPKARIAPSGGEPPEIGTTAVVS